MTFIYIMDMNKIGLILGGVAVAVNAAAELPQLTYPVAERQDVVDDYFGTKVAIHTGGLKTTHRRRRLPGWLPSAN